MVTTKNVRGRGFGNLFGRRGLDLKEFACVEYLLTLSGFVFVWVDLSSNFYGTGILEILFLGSPQVSSLGYLFVQSTCLGIDTWSTN